MGQLRLYTRLQSKDSTVMQINVEQKSLVMLLRDVCDDSPKNEDVFKNKSNLNVRTTKNKPELRFAKLRRTKASY